ncbi:MAG: TAXI family TRAP transporter solute-binding subunit [Lachnospiraceae bacterium]|nr:TAXI family TRAP transporter solute-binding subunit [Lachnospiraceae bacterium]
MKKVFCFVMAMVLILGLAACGGDKPGTTEAPKTSTEAPKTSTEAPKDSTAAPVETTQAGPKKIEALDLLAGSATGSWYTIAAGIADKFNENYEGFPMTAIPGPGSVGNIGVISSGESEIGMSYGPFLAAAVAGTSPYEEKYENLRSIACLQPTVIQPLTTLDIQTYGQFIKDQMKCTVGLYPVGNASTLIVSMILQAYGLNDPTDMEKWGASVYYADGASLADAWKDRHIDIQSPMLNVPASSVTEALVNRTDGKLVSLDEDVIQTLCDKYGFAKYTIKAGTYDGQKEDIYTVGLPIVFFCAEDADEDTVYTFTKTLYENKDYFLGVHASFAEFFPETMNEGTAIELHPGALKFYKEVGLIK